MFNTISPSTTGFPGAGHGDRPGTDPSADCLRLRVLVVDDEPALCEIAVTWIQSLGHRARVAHSATAALRILEEEGADVLFTDVIMPGAMDGLTLAAEAAQRWPTLRVLLTSGSAPILRRDDVPWPMLEKPYRSHHLLRLIPRHPA